MAIYTSDLMKNGATIARPAHESEPVTVSGSVLIPANKALTTADRILLARFPKGTIFSEILMEFPDLDAGGTPALTLNVGYQRPVVDPTKAFHATTNPYTSAAIATADDDFFELAATTAQAGGVLSLLAAGFTVTTSPESAGDVDVSIIPAANAAAAPTTAGLIKFYVKGYASDVVAEQAAQSYDFKSDYKS